MKNQTPPNWAKNAIATPQGWRDPKTGELLVSKKGLIIESKINESILEIEQNKEAIENVFVEIETEAPTDISLNELADTLNLMKQALQNDEPNTLTVPKKLGGRPKGSKNKTK